MKNMIMAECLWLRSLEQSDAEALTCTIDEFKVSNWLAGVPFPYGFEDARSFITEASENKNIWANISQGRFVGVIGLEKNLAICLPIQHGDRRSQPRQSGLLSPIALIALDLKSPTLIDFMITMPLGIYYARWALKRSTKVWERLQ